MGVILVKMKHLNSCRLSKDVIWQFNFLLSRTMAPVMVMLIESFNFSFKSSQIISISVEGSLVLIALLTWTARSPWVERFFVMWFVFERRICFHCKPNAAGPPCSWGLDNIQREFVRLLRAERISLLIICTINDKIIILIITKLSENTRLKFY